MILYLPTIKICFFWPVSIVTVIVARSIGSQSRNQIEQGSSTLHGENNTLDYTRSGPGAWGKGLK